MADNGRQQIDDAPQDGASPRRDHEMIEVDISVEGPNAPKKERKGFFKAYAEISLIKKIVIGLLLGILFYFIFQVWIPEGAGGSEGAMGFVTGVSEFLVLLGNLFVSALKAVAPILVFFLVISALTNAKTAGSMKTVVVLYIVSTLVAAIVAVVGSFIFPMELSLAVADNVEQSSPSGIGEVLSDLVMKVVDNPVSALLAITLGDNSQSANFIGILAWSIVLGIALRRASDGVKEVFQAISDAVSMIVRWVINLAPFGIMGLVYNSLASSGIGIFVEYGQIILLLVGCMLVIALVTNPLIVLICTRRNPYPLVLRCLKDSGLTAFFTRSSAANIPVNMELCRKLGLDPDNYSVSIPLGATINMAGAAVTITVMTMAAAHTVGLQVDILTAIILSVLAAVSACGASGVAGGSLLLIPLACSLFGIDTTVAMEVVAIGFIIGVIQDSCETALNSSSDVLFTATAEYRQMRLDGIPYRLGKDAFSEDELA